VHVQHAAGLGLTLLMLLAPFFYDAGSRIKPARNARITLASPRARATRCWVRVNPAHAPCPFRRRLSHKTSSQRSHNSRFSSCTYNTLLSIAEEADAPFYSNNAENLPPGGQAQAELGTHHSHSTGAETEWWHLPIPDEDLISPNSRFILDADGFMVPID